MKKIVFIFVAAFFLIVLGFTQSTAYKRPPNAVMDYVPQYVGIYDTYYSNFPANGCRLCHGDRNAGAARHQYTGSAFAACPDGCPLSPPDCLTACHSDPGNPQSITNDCKVCHIDGGIMGDLGYPHHRSDPAYSELCTACHQPNLLVMTYSVRKPYFYPTPNTHPPTPFHCENCHWPSGNTPHTAPPGWPKPIEASGPVITGSVVAGDPLPTANKPYRPLDGTHHEIDGYAFPNCSLCHANDPGYYTWDFTNPLLIRYCENCHSRESLHGIQEHVTAGHGLTVQEKCIACHGGIPDAVPPASGVKLPTITNMSPRYGPQGTSCTITGKDFLTTGSIRNVLMTPKMGATDQTHIIPSGLCTWWSTELIIFPIPSGLDARIYTVRVETDHGISNVRAFTLTGTQPCLPCPGQTPVIDSIEPPIGTENATVIVRGQNFGDRNTGDRDVLLIQDYGPIAAPIISWTDNEVQFRFLPWQFAPGTIQVGVKTEIGESNQTDFLLSKHPSLYSFEHTGTGSIKLTGMGFGDTPESVGPDGYGWNSAVTFNHPDETVTVAPGNITIWSDTEIRLTLPALQTDFHGIAVVTRYFYDSDGNDSYTLGIDKVYQTLTSDPLLFRPIECILVPDTTTIPQGGTLGFQAFVTNYTDNSATTLFATKVTLPSGYRYPPSGYLIGPLTISLNPYQSKSGHSSLDIPMTAPLGDYTYHGYVGNYGVGLYDECQFEFTVTPP